MAQVQLRLDVECVAVPDGITWIVLVDVPRLKARFRIEGISCHDYPTEEAAIEQACAEVAAQLSTYHH